MKDLFCKITYNDLIDLFFEAEEFIYLAAPGIFEEWSQALMEANKKNPDLDIQLLIDPTENGFRKHYGDIDAIVELDYFDFKIKEYKSHRLGFIITDKKALYLFNQSRVIEKDPAGFNAIKMAAANKTAILMQCFDRNKEMDLSRVYSDQLAKEWCDLNVLQREISKNRETDLTPKDLDKDDFDLVSYNLEIDPLKSPDLERRLKTYKTKIKFVEFEVNGINIAHKTIQIPNHILGLFDETLRDQIKTRLDIFNDDFKNEVHNILDPIKQYADKIRGKYLCPVISRKKNVMRVDQKINFEVEVENLKNKYQKAQPEIDTIIRQALKDVRDRLIKELNRVLKFNSNTELQRYAGNGQLSMFAKILNDEIKVPTVKKLSSNFEIEHRFYDPTYEDFYQKEFIDELFEKGFINENDRTKIISENEAFRVRPEE